MAITDSVLLSAVPNLAATGTAYTDHNLVTLGGNHVDERPAKVTTLSDMTPIGSTYLALDITPGKVDWIGIINHNLDRRRGSLWRCWACDRDTFTSDIFVGMQQLYPTSLDASSNAAGTYTAVDDDPWAAASESDYLTATAAGAWWARLGFATPSAALSTVGNDHAIVIRCKNVSAPAAAATLTVKLYEADSLVATLATKTIAASSSNKFQERIVICRFDTSDLTTASGANVQIQVEGSTESLRVYSVLWVAGLSAGAGDSGWLAVDAPPESSAFGGVSAGEVADEPTQNEFHTFSAAVDLSAAEYPMVAAALINGTIDSSPVNKLGVLAAGKLWQPTVNAASVTLAVQDASTKGKTLGGQDYGSNRRRRRVASVAFDNLTRSQMLELFERIDWRKGRLGPFFLCLFPNDAYAKRISGFWATLGESEQGGVWEAYTALDGDDATAVRWRRTYTFEECL